MNGGMQTFTSINVITAYISTAIAFNVVFEVMSLCRIEFDVNVPTPCLAWGERQWLP